MPYLQAHQDELLQYGTYALYIVAGLFAAQGLHFLFWRLFKRTQRVFPLNLHPLLLRHLRTSTRVFFLLSGVKVAITALTSEGMLKHVHLVIHILLIASIGWIFISVVLAISEWLQQKFAWSGQEDNLRNRRISTQLGIFTKIAIIFVVILTVLCIVITIPSLRNLGLSLFASAGVAGLVVGMAAKSTLANLLAGVQMAITQPIRLDDAVVVEGQFGHIEEIGSSFVIVRLGDWRRLLVPLNYFMEKPFENWTYDSTAVQCSVVLYVDYTAPVDQMRAEMERIVEASAFWDGKVRALAVSDCKDTVMEITISASAATPSKMFSLRSEIREKMIAFLGKLTPSPLPRQRSQPLSVENKV